MKLKLKEIIWEITGKCLNGCTYCGSKDIWKQEIDETKIKQIADSIAEYPPEEIDISGGDPLLVSYETHKYITDKLKKTKCKILINPKSYAEKVIEMPQQGIEFTQRDQIQAQERSKAYTKILKLYAHIGISINTIEELKHLNYMNLTNIPYTIITNFNLSNFFLFDTIAQEITKRENQDKVNVLWQIQFTMYNDNDKDHQLALYNHPTAIDKLNENIQRWPNLKLLFADNANKGECTAGMYTIGVLSTGDVVPCLSMRSWCDVLEVTEGNLLTATLKDIWVNRFKTNRFEDFKCCKDVCKKQTLKYFVKKDTWKSPIDDVTGPVYGVGVLPVYVPPKPIYPIVTVYAVQTLPLSQPSVTLYGVGTETQWGLKNVYSDSSLPGFQQQTQVRLEAYIQDFKLGLPNIFDEDEKNNE